MATMASKLKSRAQVIRSLTLETKAIKEIASEARENSIKVVISSLYAQIRELIVGEAYSPAEMKKLLDMCIKETERELKEIAQRRKALEREAKKLAKREDKNAEA